MSSVAAAGPPPQWYIPGIVQGQEFRQLLRSRQLPDRRIVVQKSRTAISKIRRPAQNDQFPAVSSKAPQIGICRIVQAVHRVEPPKLLLRELNVRVGDPRPAPLLMKFGKS